jgi:hypothetical protein
MMRKEEQMKKMLFAVTIILLSGFIQAAFCTEPALNRESVPRITKEQLKAQFGNTDLIIIDVRSLHDWEDSNIKIKGAIREEPSKLGSWINKYPQEKTIALYCK